MKGRLLASVCALGLLAAGPVLAAGNDTGGTGSPTTTPSTTTGSPGGMGTQGTTLNSGTSTPTGGSAYSSPSGMTHSNQSTNMPGMHDNAATTHPGTEPMRRRANKSMHSRSSGSATSQNAEVDRLNEQSLQAAQQGKTFEPGSGNMNSGSMGSGHMGSGSMSGSSPSGRM